MKAKKFLSNRFAKMDTDGDKKVSKDEWMAKKMAHFDKVDTNGDGNVTKEEFVAAGQAAQALAQGALAGAGKM